MRIPSRIGHFVGYNPVLLLLTLLFQIWSLGALSTWLWAKSWFEIWKGVRCCCLIHIQRADMMGLSSKGLKMLGYEIRSGHWAGVTSHGSLYTDLGIEKCLSHPLSQFQVQWAIGIYSSLFIGRGEPGSISHLFIRKEEKEQPAFPGVYRGQPDNQV